MKAGEVAIRQLIAGGVRYFAGMVGSTNAPLVATVAQSPSARFIPVRHEQVAASLLDATARLTHRPGCAILHSASGTLAASLGIAAAARDSTPLIVLTGTQERLAHQRGYWQTMDVLAPLSAMTKWQFRVEHPQDVPEVIRRALIEATTGRPGVVQVDLPIDVSLAEIDPPPLDGAIYEAPRHRPCAAPHEVVRVADLLLNAERPVLLIGGGAAYSGAGEALRRLAERLGAPVVNTPTSRGVVPEDHPLALDPSGIVGYPVAGEAIVSADCLLAIGSRLSDLQTARGTLLPADAQIVQVDIDGSVIGWLHPVALGIVADALTFTDDLNRCLDDFMLSVPAERRAWAADLRERAGRWRDDWLAAAPQNGRVQPHEIVQTLLDTLPDRAIISHGAGDHQFYGLMVPVQEPHGHLVSAALGAMGTGLAYALGAKLVQPGRPVIACLGDGELMLQLGDLETVVRENLPVTIIVFNNFRLGSQRPRMEAYGTVFGTDHGNPDFAQLARLFGIDGYRIDQPGQFRAAFEAAVAAGRPALLDVLVDPEAHPPRAAISRAAR